jgi:hypothetical protein
MDATSVLIDQIRSGSAAKNIREFAAKGVLPLAQEDLVSLQVLLAKDEDEEIAKSAQESLSKVPEGIWSKLVEKKDPDSEILLYCLTNKAPDRAIKEKILLNASVPDQIVRHLAGTESGTLLDIIISNYVRLLRDSAILAALEVNPSVTPDQTRRIEEFKTEFIVKKQKQLSMVEVSQLPYEDLLAQIPQLDEEAIRIIQLIDNTPQEEPTDEEVQQAIQNLFSVEELSRISPDIVSTYQRVLKLKHSEKVRVALLGNREERAILIRDPSRQIATLVLRSPKLTESEIDNFAQMRNIDSDILRLLGRSRGFIKRYSVVLTLVRNPKTPSATALNLIKLLRETDLRNLERDKNIPEVIRRQSKKIREMKELKKDHR